MGVHNANNQPTEAEFRKVYRYAALTLVTVRQESFFLNRIGTQMIAISNCARCQLDHVYI